MNARLVGRRKAAFSPDDPQGSACGEGQLSSSIACRFSLADPVMRGLAPLPRQPLNRIGMREELGGCGSTSEFCKGEKRMDYPSAFVWPRLLARFRSPWMRNCFSFSTNWAPTVLLPLRKLCANGALNEAEADSLQTIQPLDALPAAREAAALRSLPE